MFLSAHRFFSPSVIYTSWSSFLLAALRVIHPTHTLPQRVIPSIDVPIGDFPVSHNQTFRLLILNSLSFFQSFSIIVDEFIVVGNPARKPL